MRIDHAALFCRDLEPAIGYVHLSFAVGRLAQGDACHSKNKELYIIPEAVHTALYDDRAGVIPYDKMEDFFKTNLK